MNYPINPEYIQAAGESLTPLYRDLEDFIIQKICEQFKTGDANSSSMELIRELQRRGLSLNEIEKRIKQTLKISQRQLDNIFDNAIARNQEYYGEIIDKQGLLGDGRTLDRLLEEANAIARQTKADFFNLTQSLGFAVRTNGGIIEYQPMAQAYHTALDRAALRVMSGAESYEVAIRGAVKDLTDSGIQVVDYDTGHHDRVDVAVRRAVMTGITQISAQNSEQFAEETGTPYREVSAHRGARDTGEGWQNHKDWQGKVYSIKAGDIYPSIYAVCGLGQVDGLCGVNCRHMFFPFFEGISERTYTDEELKNIDPPPFKFEGKTYNAYAATQEQRRMERALRSVKRRMIGDKAAGLEDAYTADAIKYRRLNEEYEKFNAAADLKSYPDRAYASGFGPKESRAAIKRAAQQNVDVEIFETRMAAAGYKVEGFDKYYGDNATLDHMASSFEHMSRLYPDEVKDLKIRWGWRKDPATYGAYNHEKGEIVYNRKALKTWEETSAEYVKLTEAKVFPPGTTADSIFYHEFGHRVWYTRGSTNIRAGIKKALFKKTGKYFSPREMDAYIRSNLSTRVVFPTVPTGAEIPAEAFSAYYNNGTAKDLAELLLRELGLL